MLLLEMPEGGTFIAGGHSTLTLLIFYSFYSLNEQRMIKFEVLNLRSCQLTCIFCAVLAATRVRCKANFPWELRAAAAVLALQVSENGFV